MAENAEALAGRLIDRFGSLAAVLAASPSAPCDFLINQPRVSRFLRTIRAAHVQATRRAIVERPVFEQWQHLLDYLTVALAHLTYESFRALFLNSRKQLIRDEELARGTIDCVDVFPREVIRSALDVGAASMILVHNHPSGDPIPSKADIAVTRQVQDAAKLFGIAVHDHVIIGTEGYTSLRAKGLMH